ncbi:response regulator [Methylocucumis oryzae]|uniref:LuxR family transcriptional regulator n=1 Tax=Methylocucumis oryzae TaxID=1632867 RepID=A0A0F3IJB4_9GAMM|nr:response regulator transcription factor [Methylocucumis oryzae]KJV06608.1 LuxR family transcriptional regulator [Methylocucumis oryzae]
MPETISTIRLLLVDDHAIVRAGYKTLLAKQPGMTIAAEAEDAASAYKSYQDYQPDVVVMDISLPGASGLEALTRIKSWDAKAKVLVFTMHQNPGLALKACQAGALGYITKSSPPELLLRAITEVYAGRVTLSPEIMQDMALHQVTGGAAKLAALSLRELEIFRLLAQGRQHQQIAALLHISPKTVSNSHSLIKQKLSVNNDAELTLLALNNGLIFNE